MSFKLLTQLRLLNPTLPLTHFNPMKFGSSISLSRTVTTISRIFSFKLKYHGLAPYRFLKTEQLGLRTYSTRPFQQRTGSGGSELRRNGERGGVRAAKSLVEDEAELSDWIGDLRSGSFRGGLYSEDESDGDRVRSVRHRGGGKETVPIKKSRRDFDSDEFVDSVGRRGSRGMQFGSNGNRVDNELRKSGKKPRKARFNVDDEDEDEDEDEDRVRSVRHRGGGKETLPIKKSRRDFDSDEFVDSVGRRGSRGMQFGSNGNRVDNELRKSGKKPRKARFNVDDEDEDEDEDEDGEETRRRFGDLLSDTDEDESSDEQEEEVSSKVIPKSSPDKSDSYLSETRFDQVPISPLSLKAIKDAGYEKMTVVQEATLSLILQGKDVLAKAKTGTGKTVAFLLPSIEVVTKSPPISRDERRPPIFVLVICPTRELAGQAAAEANTLLKFHPSIGVQVVMGGTRLPPEQKRLQEKPCQILVATPGRLKDHMENTAGFATRLRGVKVLVLDEADHLLDMGFRKDIEKIIAAVPKQRQTLLFSATVPEEVRQISLIALKRDYEFVNTVQEGSIETNSQVKQAHLVASLDEHFSLLYVLLKEHIADDVDYKVILFCTTAMMTRLVASLLGELNLNVREIHSRKSQGYRTRISDEFRKSKGLILVTSDVSARGVDYPDVTLVIQMGLPSDREQYIHRLGRTGRKGKEGQGMLLLAPWEAFFLSEIKNLPITKAPVPSVDQDIKKKVERALNHVEMMHKEAAYQAFLGYYNSQKKVGRDKCMLVELANEFSRSMGLDNPPAIPKLVLGKMGLRNIPGLRSK